jgi:methyltransferase-like protein/protein-L-isoaspartate O-methyltransferase
MSDEKRPNAYDQLPYPSLAYAQTHPDRLATLATVLGMKPAPVDCCRVLELGCASGGNLIPMAYALPGSEFVGVDASQVQIAEGQRVVADLALDNVKLLHMDILDIDASLGQFDYIIVHGVYSWVPPVVRDKILQVCKENLAPQGVSYVSYNTYPGWHMIDIVRGIMVFSSQDVDEPEMRAVKGRSSLRQLAEMVPGEGNVYGGFLQMYAQLIDGEVEDSSAKSNALLFHDEMEENNDPVYFYQFAAHAARHGLQYLGDFHHASGGALAPEVTAKLQAMSRNHIELEQHLDFLQNRTFRQTLLCHDDVVLSRSVKASQARAFFAASRAEPVSEEPDIASVSIEQFRGHDGALLSINHPVSKAAMLCLAEAWPRAMSFEELLTAARRRLAREAKDGNHGSDGDLDAEVLGANLLRGHGYSQSLVELHVHAAPVASVAGERPRASRVARLWTSQSDTITNLRHERLKVDPLVRYLLPFLDGSRDREALLQTLLEGPVARGELTIEQDGTPARDVGQALVVEIENTLAWLLGAGLLIDPTFDRERRDDPR